MRRTLIDYSILVLAGVLYAIALKYFVLPSKVILTGTEGIATALSYYFESYALFIILYMLFQAGLLVFAFVGVSRVFALRSLVVVSVVVLSLMLLPELRFADPDPSNERIILVLFGGLLAGVAKALAFTRRGSTGDEDILGAYFAIKYLKPVGSIAIVAVGNAITTASAHRTYTEHEGKGGHRGETCHIVRTIITQEELPQMIASIHAADPDCFYYHHDIEGISGQYYISPIG